VSEETLMDMAAKILIFGCHAVKGNKKGPPMAGLLQLCEYCY
jgi:hypothetical protein